MMPSASQVMFIFGGTFDPIHYGHLRLAQTLYNLNPNASVKFLVNGNPPHRNHPTASSVHRLAMANLSIQGMEFCHVDDREIQRDDVSYTYLSINELKQSLPEASRLVLVVGADAFEQFHTWKQHQEILKVASLLVVTRPGASFHEADSALLNQLDHCEDPITFFQKSNGAVFFFQNPMLDISSSQIRVLLEKRQSARFLLPDAIIEYISQHNLYV